jgi:hypothetical protein
VLPAELLPPLLPPAELEPLLPALRADLVPPAEPLLPLDLPLPPALRGPRVPTSLEDVFGFAIVAVGWHNAASIDPMGALPQSTADWALVRLVPASKIPKLAATNTPYRVITRLSHVELIILRFC